MGWSSGLIVDLRFALRTLTKRPLFTLMVVLTLGLGIGATSSIFSVVSAVLLRPLPYQDAGELVRLWQTSPIQGTRTPSAAGNFVDWRARNQVFTDMAAFVPTFYNLTGSDQPERLTGARVTPGMFELLGVSAQLGRAFDRLEQDASVAVLGHGLWQRRFGSDPAVVGRTLSINGGSYQIIGVMPPEFEILPGAELWTPLILTPEDISERGSVFLGVMARLKKGVSLEMAQGDLGALAEALAQEYPVNQGWGVAVASLREQIVGDIRGTLLTLFGAVGFVMLVSCANVANLLLARATERLREIAIRTTLGADRVRLIRQSLTEGLVLSVAGGAVGLLLTSWGIRLLLELDPGRIPNLDKIGIDWRVLAFTVALSLLTGVLFGLLPLLQISSNGVYESLKQGGGQSTSARSRNRMRSSLVVIEVALALVLLLGAGLMIRSFQRLLKVDPGFNPTDVLVAPLNLAPESYPTPPQKVQFFQQALEKVRSIPGVRYAGAATTLPLVGGQLRESFYIEGRELPLDEEAVLLDVITPGYLQAMGIRVLQGRDFTDRDRADAPPVALIDEAMARYYWPGESAVGKRLGLPALYGELVEVVGVVATVRRSGLDEDVEPQIYLPLGDSAYPFMSLVVRAPAGPTATVPAIREAIWSIDADQPVPSIRTMEEIVRRSVSQRHFNMRIMEVFAVMALVLAVVGIHGVLSYWVSQRRHEIGIRMALGSRKSEVLKLVIGRGLVLTAAGVAVGLFLAFVLGRAISSMLFGVAPTDPLTFFSLTLLMAMVSLLACYFPARRAMGVDPMVALRSE